MPANMMSEPRVEAVGDGQKERHGQRRADARQHAHGGADGHAQERVEQVDRLQRCGETLGEER
jgi:hypothetical protein